MRRSRTTHEANISRLNMKEITFHIQLSKTRLERTIQLAITDSLCVRSVTAVKREIDTAVHHVQKITKM